MSSPGVKHDNGKLRMDLIPRTTFEAMARILGYGAFVKGYGPNNWQGVEPHRYHAAILRHIAAINGGEDLDPESGLPHWEHVLCNAAFMVHKRAESIAADKDKGEG